LEFSAAIALNAQPAAISVKAERRQERVKDFWMSCVFIGNAWAAYYPRIAVLQDIALSGLLDPTSEMHTHPPDDG
jgi:hypothetical protein